MVPGALHLRMRAPALARREEFGDGAGAMAYFLAEWMAQSGGKAIPAPLPTEKQYLLSPSCFPGTSEKELEWLY